MSPRGVSQVVFALAALSLVACGPSSPAGADAGAGDGGVGSGGADAGRTVTSTGTIGGGPAGLAKGYAKVISGESIHLRLSSLADFQCRTTGSDALKAGEVSVDVWVEPVQGQSLIGTFQFKEVTTSSPQKPGTAGGFVARAPAVCPASVGDGTAIVSGSITVSNTVGVVAGTMSITSKDGEAMTADFNVPTCELVSAAQADCVP